MRILVRRLLKLLARELLTNRHRRSNQFPNGKPSHTHIPTDK